MLERISTVKGVGLLHNADGRAHSLKKATFIYADNGRGKSTLASIFRSCSTNNPSLVINRRTIDSTDEQEILLRFSHGEISKFKNGVWDKSRPEILVFDSDFVEQNVYAGGQVSTTQRKSLLQFALGESSVVAQREYDQADHAWKLAIEAVRETTSRLSTVHQGLNLEEFKKITKVPDADEQIIVLNSRIAEARNIGLIQAKASPKLLQYPRLEYSRIISILKTSIDNIDLMAESQVRAHLDLHQKHGLEKWISDGNNFGESENCLFCNQSLNGVDIIRAYRSYFNQDYNRLKSDVFNLSTLINASFPEKIIDNLKSQVETASAVINGWQEYLEILPPTFNESDSRQALSNIRTILERLKQQKESNLLEEISTDDQTHQIVDNWQVIINALDSCNEQINISIQQIAEYKENLSNVDIEQLRQQINELEFAQVRHREDIIDLLDQLNSSQQTEVLTQTKKQTKKTALNQVMQTTLDSYKDRINQLLWSFGAQFFIPNINFDYRGSLRSDYSLEMRGSKIALTGGIPDFNTSLSEGDKRTLAFAFFIASTESTLNLADKIIIIDDPMSSLDLNRKQQTQTILMRLYQSCKQLVVIAHDMHFLRNLRDSLPRNDVPNNIKFLKLKSVTQRYSDFGTIDIDQECESAYFKSHRILGEFMEGRSQNNMDVARSIRPMLEGYLHRRFPGLINPGLLFGQVVSQISQAMAPSPLIHAQNIIDELNQINSYAGQFHHDTNPAADQIQIVESELLGFVERAINVIHIGSV